MSSLNLGSTKGEMSCRCLSSMNGVYYGLKASIFIEVDDLFLSGSCPQGFKNGTHQLCHHTF
jgi:hypothetical protein